MLLERGEFIVAVQTRVTAADAAFDAMCAQEHLIELQREVIRATREVADVQKRRADYFEGRCAMLERMIDGEGVTQ